MRIDDHAVLAAARVLAICAYPSVRNLKTNGMAHRYAEALVAYMFRGAKASKRIDRYPEAGRLLKSAAMWSRLQTGHRRLVTNLRACLTIESAANFRRERDDFLAGKISGISIIQSRDFLNLEIRIGALENHRVRSSIKGSLEYHGFIGAGDRDEAYKNIHRDVIRPTERVMHIAIAVINAARKIDNDAKKLRIPFELILMRRPDWALDIVEQTEANIPLALHTLKRLGVSIPDKELIRLTR